MSELPTNSMNPEPERSGGVATLEREEPVAAPPPTSPGYGNGGEAPRRRFSFVRRHPKGVIGLLVLLILVALATFAVLATNAYGNKYEGKILPGAQIAGVDVGGMSRQGAIAAVRDAIEPQLDRKVRVTWRNEKFIVTPGELGARSNAVAAVDAALSESDDASFLDLAKMRWLSRDLDFNQTVALKYPRSGVHDFIAGVAGDFNRKPEDASLDYSTGWLKLVPSQMGRKVDKKASETRLYGALTSGSHGAPLEVEMIKPEVTAADFDQALLLRQGDFRVYLYERQGGKLKITHDWLVAVGQPAYPTPTGLWEVVDKVSMPTWINPDPDGWGASMPASIPPGIGNPLGLRAVYWDASGIRFHGTSDIGSLGNAASHGCVRLSNDDVIELYNLVDVGTPIVSTY